MDVARESARGGARTLRGKEPGPGDPDLARREVSWRVAMYSDSAAPSRHVQERLKRFEAHSEMSPLLNAMGMLAAALALPAAGLAVFLADDWLRLSFSWWGLLVAYFAFTAGMAFPFLPSFSLFWLVRRAPPWRRISRNLRTAALAAGFILLSAEIALLVAIREGGLADLPNWLLYGIGAGVLASVATTPVLMISMVVMISTMAIEKSVKRTVDPVDPVDAVVHSLMDVHSRLELLPDSWDDLDFRADLSLRLDWAAQTLEHDVADRLATDRLGAGSELREAFAGRAAAIRELQVWVSLPKADTREHLLRRLADSAQRLAIGDWSGLPSRDAFPVRPGARLPSAIRALSIAALPALVLLGIQLSSFALDQPTLDYATVGVAGWAVLSIMLEFDPELPAKLSLFSRARDQVKLHRRE